jgi:2-amino-4-hydroxy-6-hydroxymethyldihydropteridine diphosphokinase
MSRYDVFLGIGSNLGERGGFLARGVEEIKSIPDSKIVWVSPVYETEPYGRKDQPPFLNAALQLDTALPPDELFSHLKAIERKVGRTGGERWGPRELDIDILIYDGLVFDRDGLKVPHPDMEQRNFVLVPLKDIAPDLVHPVTGLTVTEMARQCPTGGRLVRSIQTLRY